MMTPINKTGSDAICRKLYNDNSYGVFNDQNPLNYGFPLFLTELACLVVVSQVVRLILKPLRQPKVISHVIGGIILGPSVLSGNEVFQKQMFPDNAQYVLKNVGTLGFMYFLFVSGVKMDIFSVRKVDKKHWYIALVGVGVPLVFSVAVAVAERKSLPVETGKPYSIIGITTSLAISAFPVLYQVVKEFNLVSSEMGQMALSTAIIGDIIGNTGVIVFEAGKQGANRPIAALWYLISLIMVLAVIMGGLRQAMLWIVRKTPEGKPVDQIYVVVILSGVLAIGFVADMLGLAVANGPLWLGLAVPDGPPLGAILVEKSETIMLDIFLPCSFMYVGMLTDFSSLSQQWSYLQPLFTVVITGYTIKLVSTFIVARYLDLTLRDSLTLSLLLSLRGEVELLLFIHWIDFKMIDRSQFTLLVLVSLTVTALAVPIISIVYDPTKPYMVNKRRSIQHMPPNAELHIVALVHDEENLYGILKLLEFSTPSVNNPFCVYALHHVELVGRATPVFIDHDEEESISERMKATSAVHKGLRMFQEEKRDYLKIHAYTAITPRRTMYQDVCELALSKQACAIILSMRHETFDNLDGTRVVKKQGYQTVGASILSHTPCSVGILVDRTPYMNVFGGASKSATHHFVVLFLGGADAREALSYAERTMASQTISLTVVRFLAHDGEGDDEMEKSLDDKLVTSFWVKNEGNDRSTYREVVVKDGEETINAIRAMNNEDYDLWIVGRKNGINEVLLQGLPNYGDDSELGVIGDYVSSADFRSRASVLVLQQQILRGEDHRTSGCSWCPQWFW